MRDENPRLQKACILTDGGARWNDECKLGMIRKAGKSRQASLRPHFRATSINGSCDVIVGVVAQYSCMPEPLLGDGRRRPPPDGDGAWCSTSC